MINFVLVIQKSFNLRNLKFHQDMNKRTHFNYHRMAMLLVMLATILTASAQKARQEKANSQKNKSNKSNKSASLLNSSSSKLSQSQRNDSIRASQYNGRKTNKSSADND